MQFGEQGERIDEELRPAEQAVPATIGVFNPTSDINYNDYPLLFFAAEIRHAAGDADICKRMIRASEKGLLSSSNELLALVKFGNHGDEVNEAGVAVYVENTKKYLEASCGDRGGTTGMADALAKFVDYLQKNDEVKNKFPKLCILICFITRESSNLEYFRCPGGKDAIKLCNTLAEYGMPLYVIGIDHTGMEACARDTHDENHFLSGLALIGGGLYIKVSDVNNVKEAIQCIIKENTSIEDLMGTVDDIAILKRNKGDTYLNIEHLAEYIQEQLNLRSCTVDAIRLDNRPPQEISQIAQRFAWSDDLDDAMNAVKAWKDQSVVQNLELSQPMEISQSVETSQLMGPSQSMETSQRKRKANSNPAHTKHRKDASSASSVITLAKRQRVSKDVARRMLRRQMTRLVFIMKTEISIGNPMTSSTIRD